ncbi:hypothetical protein NECAME_11776 [Necator americanus]|uniref:Uncharacterized protein n=1 Tax=Necator americanus TaxID=51031 RepID=W2T2Q5_NECAM|nr:hypothetical protein NECAME_11776 [Necator americanus]ETN76270.1 hypothetical protein NECAME_11776 [Necator americanus]
MQLDYDNGMKNHVLFSARRQYKAVKSANHRHFCENWNLLDTCVFYKFFRCDLQNKKGGGVDSFVNELLVLNLDDDKSDIAGDILRTPVLSVLIMSASYLYPKHSNA